jgi:hypothetical protein
VEIFSTPLFVCPPPLPASHAILKTLVFWGGDLYLNPVGKTYFYECPQCQYQAKISGGADSGIHCEIQTVVCRDCRELYDVFRRRRQRADAVKLIRFPGFYRPDIPPVILGESSINPSSQALAPLIWVDSDLKCPIMPDHFVEPWNEPGRCPKCGNFMERNGFPFRAWD